MTAIWKGITYTIHYNLNGGTGSFADQTKGYNGGITLSKTIPMKEGLDFVGWKGSNGTTYKAGASYAGNADLTLTAIWSFEVIYNGNGGIGATGPNVPSASQTVIEGATVKINDNCYTLDGYTFVGWAESSNATVVKYKPNDIVTFTENTILYAVWQPNKYLIVYDMNDGKATEFKRQDKIHNVSINIVTDIPTREGFTFAGWSESENGDAKWAPGSTFSKNTSLRLYAVWNAINYTIKFYPDDPLSGRDYDHDEVVSVTIPYGTEMFEFPNLYDFNDPDNGLFYDYYSWVNVGTTASYKVMIDPGEKVRVSDIPFNKDGECSYYAFTSYNFIIYHNYIGSTESGPFNVDRKLQKEFLARELWTELDEEHKEDHEKFPDVSVGNTTQFIPGNDIMIDGYGYVVDISWIHGEKSAIGIDGAHFIGWTTDPKNPREVFLPGDVIEITNKGRCIELYALWAPKETEYFEDCKSRIWIGATEGGTPGMVLYLSADQVGTGTIENAIKGADDPDYAWRLRSSYSFASILYEIAEQKPLPEDVSVWNSVRDSVISTAINQALKQVDGEFQTLFEDENLCGVIKKAKKTYSHASDKYVPIVKWLLCETALDLDDISNNSIEKLLNLGIERKYGIVDGSNAKSLRVEIVGGRIVGISLFDLNNTHVMSGCINMEGLWLEINDSGNYIVSDKNFKSNEENPYNPTEDTISYAEVLDDIFPGYRQRYFTNKYYPSNAAEISIDNSKRLVWEGFDEDGYYIAVVYIPKELVGTGTIADAARMSEFENVDEAWKYLSKRNLVSRFFDDYAKQLRSFDYTKVVNFFVDETVFWTRILTKFSWWSKCLIKIGGDTVKALAADKYYTMNHTQLDDLVELFRFNGISRTAGIVYYPKGICMVLNTGAASVLTMSRCDEAPDTTQAPSSGYYGKWTEITSEGQWEEVLSRLLFYYSAVVDRRDPKTIELESLPGEIRVIQWQLCFENNVNIPAVDFYYINGDEMVCLASIMGKDEFAEIFPFEDERFYDVSVNGNKVNIEWSINVLENSGKRSIELVIPTNQSQ